MVNWEGLDRRKFPRVKFPCLVVIKDKQEDQDVLLSHTENIAIGGVCVIVKKSVKMFSEVDLEIDLLDMEPHIHCKGKVVWNVQRKSEEKKKPLFYDIGIEFQSVTESERKRLDIIIAKLVEQNQEVQ